MCCIDLNNDRLKILGIQFSYNEKLNEEENLCKTVTDIQRVLKIWKMRNLTLEGKIFILKQYRYQKIFFQSFVTTLPKHFVSKPEKMQDFFME